MSGEGYFLGVAVAAYEWIAAIALIVVAIWFIPVYLKNHIYTMPQFLKTMYNESVALIMAVFWLFLYVFPRRIDAPLGKRNPERDQIE